MYTLAAQLAARLAAQLAARLAAEQAAQLLAQLRHWSHASVSMKQLAARGFLLPCERCGAAKALISEKPVLFFRRYPLIFLSQHPGLAQLVWKLVWKLAVQLAVVQLAAEPAAVRLHG